MEQASVAEVTTEKVIEVKAADPLRLLLGQTGKTWLICSLLIRLGLQDGGTLYLACMDRLVLLLQDEGTLIPDHKGALTRILPANLRVSFHTHIFKF